MKYLKSYEQLEEIAYSVGDIVVCIDRKFAEIGTKFIVKNIFTYIDYGDLDTKIQLTKLYNHELNKYHFVTVKNLDRNNQYNGIWSNKFVSELKYDIMKFNI